MCVHHAAQTSSGMKTSVHVRVLVNLHLQRQTGSGSLQNADEGPGGHRREVEERISSSEGKKVHHTNEKGTDVHAPATPSRSLQSLDLCWVDLLLLGCRYHLRLQPLEKS